MTQAAKVWFVTGASRGFGRIWTEAALKRGDRVVATARDTEGLEDLVSTYGDAVLTLPLDVTDRDAVFQTVKRAHQRFGGLDVILCNAGYGYMGAVEEAVTADAHANFDTNVFGTLSVIQAALPLLRAQRSGHILTVSSIGGVIGFPTGGIYAATKFAVEGMSEALAGEVASFGIKVTIIEPGSFTTGFRSSIKAAPAMAEYDGVRQAVLGAFKPEMSGDPLATAPAILQLVDAEKPPLRLLLGAGPLPMIKRLYEGRLSTWEQWAEVSNTAQGTRAA
ncbi:SDR family NAD(P)-dependent oxidoreductase [Beijerinckia sp. L45]|uniref:SDR family NAD(P)-dependent oxidoreductase n=1 Tax=Beijerinckia sp. L45 TaxID=1641855 RepID=UPI00131C6261|nr:SDR family NAD(P)-dependent oxidoreductase [Beijerinckia sp. L45]